MISLRQVLAGTALVATTALVTTAVPGSASSPAQAPARNVTEAAQAKASDKGTITSRVFGEFGRNGTVRGTFDAKRFISKGGETYAVGLLHAKLRRGDGTLVGSANREIAVPVKNARAFSAETLAARGASCDILNLVLGPLDLNLLGLEVHLNRVVLNIEATPGAGNLLGNLLCAVAGLLDGNQLRLANVLDRILSILRV